MGIRGEADDGTKRRRLVTAQLNLTKRRYAIAIYDLVPYTPDFCAIAAPSCLAPGW